METITVKVGYKGFAKITYADGSISRITPDKWQALQIARAKCRAEYGENVEAVWYYDQLCSFRRVAV